MAQYTMMWIFSKLFRHFYVQRSHVEMLKAAQEVSVLKVNVVVMLSPSLFLPQLVQRVGPAPVKLNGSVSED